ncbi:unnamed protein product, partial [Ectocarpus fasciculatus]
LRFEPLERFTEGLRVWRGRGGGGVLLRFACLTVRSWTTRPREDGALSPQDRSSMVNRSFLLCQSWLKNVVPSLSVLSISVATFVLLPGPPYSEYARGTHISGGCCALLMSAICTTSRNA